MVLPETSDNIEVRYVMPDGTRIWWPEEVQYLSLVVDSSASTGTVSELAQVQFTSQKKYGWKKSTVMDMEFLQDMQIRSVDTKEKDLETTAWSIASAEIAEECLELFPRGREGEKRGMEDNFKWNFYPYSPLWPPLHISST